MCRSDQGETVECIITAFDGDVDVIIDACFIIHFHVFPVAAFRPFASNGVFSESSTCRISGPATGSSTLIYWFVCRRIQSPVQAGSPRSPVRHQPQHQHGPVKCLEIQSDIQQEFDAANQQGQERDSCQSDTTKDEDLSLTQGLKEMTCQKICGLQVHLHLSGRPPQWPPAMPDRPARSGIQKILKKAPPV